MPPLLFSNTGIFANDASGQDGTVGGFFTLPDSPGIYGITNFHVIEQGGTATQDAAIFQQGTGIQIGTLERWYLPTTTGLNRLDLALFLVDQSVMTPTWNTQVSGFADANSVTSVQLNLGNNIVHFGTALGLKPGPFPVPIDGVTYNFTNLLQIQSASDGHQFSRGGDSGSLIFADDLIVALLIGCDQSNPFITYGIPFIDTISKKGILNATVLKVMP